MIKTCFSGFIFMISTATVCKSDISLQQTASSDKSHVRFGRDTPSIDDSVHAVTSQSIAASNNPSQR